MQSLNVGGPKPCFNLLFQVVSISYTERNAVILHSGNDALFFRNKRYLLTDFIRSTKSQSRNQL